MGTTGFVEDVTNIAWLTLLALVGIIARVAHISAAEGVVKWRQLGMACFTAPFLGVLAGGFAQWVGAPSFAQQAIAALVGFLGPAFVTVTAERLRDLWVKKAGG